MSDNQLTIHDRLEDILDSINLIQEWSDGRTSVNDFLSWFNPRNASCVVLLSRGKARNYCKHKFC